MEIGQQVKPDSGVWRLELVSCPECGSESPKMKRCLKCGHVFQFEEEAETEPVEKEAFKTDGLLEKKVDGEKGTMVMNEHLECENQIGQSEIQRGECSQATRDVMENLVKSMSMQLWSLDMLHEGKVDERQFDRLFTEYSARFRPCLDQRNEMLEVEKEIEPLEAELKEARLRSEELEMRKTIRDISEDEYRVKMPAINWDISHCEKGLKKRKSEVAFLKDLSKVLSEAEIMRMQEKAMKCVEIMERGGVLDINPETSAKVRDALKDMQDCFESFGFSISP